MIRFGLLVLGLIAAGTGCRKDYGDDLDIWTAKKSYRVSNTQDYSCGNLDRENPPDIQASHINFRTLSIKWRGAQPFTIEGVRVTLNSDDISGGTFTKEVVGSDFEILLPLVGGVPVRVLRQNEVISLRCDLKIGGIGLLDPKSSGFGSGYVQLIGTTPDGDVDAVVDSQTYFSFEYTPR